VHLKFSVLATDVAVRRHIEEKSLIFSEKKYIEQPHRPAELYKFASEKIKEIEVL
jgi:hypothetical protein